MSTILNSYSPIGISLSQVNDNRVLDIYNYTGTPTIELRKQQCALASFYINVNQGDVLKFACSIDDPSKQSMSLKDDLDNVVAGTTSSYVNQSVLTYTAIYTETLHFEFSFDITCSIGAKISKIVAHINREDENILDINPSLFWIFAGNSEQTLVRIHQQPKILDPVLPARMRVNIHGVWDSNNQKFVTEKRAWMPGVLMPLNYANGGITGFGHGHTTSDVLYDYYDQNLGSAELAEGGVEFKGYATLSDMQQKFLSIKNSGYYADVVRTYYNNIDTLENNILNGVEDSDNNYAGYHHVLDAHATYTDSITPSGQLTDVINLWAVYGIKKYDVVFYVYPGSTIIDGEEVTQFVKHVAYSEYIKDVPNSASEFSFPGRVKFDVPALIYKTNRNFCFIAQAFDFWAAGPIISGQPHDRIDDPNSIQVFPNTKKEYYAIPKSYTPVFYSVRHSGNNYYFEGTVDGYNDNTVSGLSLSNYTAFVDDDSEDGLIHLESGTYTSVPAAPNVRDSNNKLAQYFAGWYSGNTFASNKYCSDTFVVDPDNNDMTYMYAKMVNIKRITFDLGVDNTIGLKENVAVTDGRYLFDGNTYQQMDGGFDSAYNDLTGSELSVLEGATVNPAAIRARFRDYSKQLDYFKYNNSEFNFSTPITEDITLTAVWKDCYKITLHYNDGDSVIIAPSSEYTVDSQGVIWIDSDYNSFSIDNISLTNDWRLLEGWYTSSWSSGDTPDPSAKVSGNIAVSYDIDLYAHVVDKPKLVIHIDPSLLSDHGLIVDNQHDNYNDIVYSYNDESGILEIALQAQTWASCDSLPSMTVVGYSDGSLKISHNGQNYWMFKSQLVGENNSVYAISGVFDVYHDGDQPGYYGSYIRQFSLDSSKYPEIPIGTTSSFNILIASASDVYLCWQSIPVITYQYNPRNVLDDTDVINPVPNATTTVTAEMREANVILSDSCPIYRAPDDVTVLSQYYVFYGWWTTSNDDGLPFDFDDDLYGNIALYAHWGFKPLVATIDVMSNGFAKKYERARSIIGDKYGRNLMASGGHITGHPEIWDWFPNASTNGDYYEDDSKLRWSTNYNGIVKNDSSGTVFARSSNSHAFTAKHGEVIEFSCDVVCLARGNYRTPVWITIELCYYGLANGVYSDIVVERKTVQVTYDQHQEAAVNVRFSHVAEKEARYYIVVTFNENTAAGSRVTNMDMRIISKLPLSFDNWLYGGWDGSWELGPYKDATGEPYAPSELVGQGYDYTGYIRSADYISAQPDTQYLISVPSGSSKVVYEYDQNENYLGKLNSDGTTRTATKYLTFEVSGYFPTGCWEPPINGVPGLRHDYINSYRNFRNDISLRPSVDVIYLDGTKLNSDNSIPGITLIPGLDYEFRITYRSTLSSDRYAYIYYDSSHPSDSKLCGILDNKHTTTAGCRFTATDPKLYFSANQLTGIEIDKMEIYKYEDTVDMSGRNEYNFGYILRNCDLPSIYAPMFILNIEETHDNETQTFNVLSDPMCLSYGDLWLTAYIRNSIWTSQLLGGAEWCNVNSDTISIDLIPYDPGYENRPLYAKMSYPDMCTFFPCFDIRSSVLYPCALYNDGTRDVGIRDWYTSTNSNFYNFGMPPVAYANYSIKEDIYH